MFSCVLLVLFVIFCTQFNVCGVVEQSLSAPGSAKKKAPAKAKAKGKTTAKSASKAKEEKSAVKSEHEAPAEAAAGSSSASAQAHEAGGGGGGPLVKKEPEIQQARAEEVCFSVLLFAAFSASN